MTIKRLTDQTAISVPDIEDIGYIVDNPGGTADSRKVTYGRLLGQLGYDIPGGRLTLESGVPVSTTDQTAKTTIYYTPYIHNKIRLFDGTRWELFDFTERSIAVPATTNQMYDVFIYDNAGTLTLELTAWTNDTTRATAIVRQDGVYVKSGATTRRYLGSFRTTGVSGQTEDSVTKRFVWNYYNRVMRRLSKSDYTNHTYNSSTWRYWNNDSTMIVEFVLGVAEDVVSSYIAGRVADYGKVSPGLDGVSTIGGLGVENGSSTLISAGETVIWQELLGYRFIAMAESATSGTGDLDYCSLYVAIKN